MEQVEAATAAPVRFETHPSRYVHWRLELEPPVARLVMDVQEDRPLRAGHPLKLNSYDLGVDLELADAVERLRFEHPDVRVLVITSGKDRVFCSGANIYMLGSSSHAFKVNFCKYTNETRLAIEDASAASGLRSLAAVNGACAGGGYELALACDEILLVDDASSAVSLPEVSLLGVLPGTGGLTRVVDKRRVRRDLADVFSSLGEGVKGKRAVQWGLVDETVPLSRFAARVEERARALAGDAPARSLPGVELGPLAGRYGDGGVEHRYVTLEVAAADRVATLTVRGPDEGEPGDAAGLRARGSDLWALRAFRELDDVLLDLRFNRPEIGVVVLRTRGDLGRVLAADHALAELRDDWFAREVRHHVKRVLKRLDLTARTLLAVVDEGSCFAGSLFELALAADRIYMLDAADGPRVALSALNREGLPMANGLTRLQTRFFGRPELVEALPWHEPVDAQGALAAGLVTFAPDEIDWEDEVRLAVEERASLSPDALTGMEANLRFPGPETMETKIFGRLSAWQNWIFQRPNAVGDKGALTLYGRPERPKFNWTRT
ncbi:MAG TPA: 2,3-epoxybenzoyl-CoA dihydrolase [Vicinamibacteria bacterium]|nr:2,3-epoxybenzoyl-CoA dihydrolase [Vicinamibacteria bacterium]